jgi:hypothetical protein
MEDQQEQQEEILNPITPENTESDSNTEDLQITEEPVAVSIEEIQEATQEITPLRSEKPKRKDKTKKKALKAKQKAKAKAKKAKKAKKDKAKKAKVKAKIKAKKAKAKSKKAKKNKKNKK